MRSLSLKPLWLTCLALASGCQKRPEGPNILLITLDTTRRDHLGMYGYEIPTSPNLDRLAADSVVYTKAYAVSSWTLPTHASMFTGKFPSSHGASYDPEGPLNLGEGIGKQFSGYRARPIAEGEVTLAQILSEHGYETGGVVAGPWMLERFRLGRGFQHYDDEGISALNGRPAESVTDAAIEFVEEHGGDPFFLFLNYYDPHGPWFIDPPKGPDGKPLSQPQPNYPLQPVLPKNPKSAGMDYPTFAGLCYDAEIHHMDSQIGRLMDHLKVRGLYENTWIFVLSDHGELMGDNVLGETGLWGHGDSLTEAEIHIPFFVKEAGPAPRTGEDASPVQQVDILPSILAHLGLPLPPDVQGQPLGGKHLILAELTKLPMMSEGGPNNPKDWRHKGDWRVLVEGQDKFGWSSNGTHYLVDLKRTPDELGTEANRLESNSELAQRLEQALQAYVKQMPKPGETGEVEQATPAELEALKSLGYIGE